MKLFKRLFTRTKPRATPLSSDSPPDVTQPPQSVPKAANELTSPEDGARLTPTSMLAREELIAPPTPPADKYADDVGDDDGEDPDDADAEGEDRTLGSGATLKMNLPTAGELLDARSEADCLALAGSHRITPNDPAGPGSLAEALARLEAEGRVHSKVVDDPASGFYILYQPVV